MIDHPWKHDLHNTFASILIIPEILFPSHTRTCYSTSLVTYINDELMNYLCRYSGKPGNYVFENKRV